MVHDSAVSPAAAVVETLYVMIKPPSETAARIDAFRRERGIACDYDRHRLHVTLFPLVDVRRLPAGALEELIAIVAGVDADPFVLTLDRLRGNVLTVGSGARTIAALRRSIECALARRGRALRFDNRPHLSLAYGRPSAAAARIDPIAWTVDQLQMVGSVLGRGQHIDRGRIALRPRQGKLF